MHYYILLFNFCTIFTHCFKFAFEVVLHHNTGVLLSLSKTLMQMIFNTTSGHTYMHLIHLHRKYKYQHVYLYRALRLHLNFKSAVKQSCYAINWCNQGNASSVTTLTKALAQIGLFVNENFGRDHISKRHEHLQKILVPTLLGQVIDEQVGALWPYSIW